MKKHSIIDNETDKIAVTDNFCPVNATIVVLSGKWKMRILWELQSGTKRFGQLKEAMPKVTPAVLSTQLQSLTNEGIISRQVFAEIPPKVEYQLTSMGRSLLAVLCTMELWGIEYIKSANLYPNTECLWNNFVGQDSPAQPV